MGKQDSLNIKIFISDVDGVLTDGGVFIDHEGRKLRLFSVIVGIAFRMAHSVGLLTGIVSGHDSPEVLSRAQELGIAEVHLGAVNKIAVVDSIIGKYNLHLLIFR